MEFKFTFDDKEYILNEDNLEYFVNDEEKPIKDIDEKRIIEILHDSGNVEFIKAFLIFLVKVAMREWLRKRSFLIS